MDKSANHQWQDAVLALETTFRSESVILTQGLVDSGQLPQFFYTLPKGARVVILGLGDGVLAFRHATWDETRQLICVERLARHRRAARRLAQDLKLHGMSFVESLDATTLATGEEIDLLIFEPDAISLDGLERLLASRNVRAVLGSYYDEFGSAPRIRRACSEGSGLFFLHNLTTGEEIRGHRRSAVEVTALVALTKASGHLERCIDSLASQADVRCEILITHPASDPELASTVRRLSEKHSTLIRPVEVDSNEQGECINGALATARGDYIAFVDPDDWCEPDHFARLHFAAMKNNAEVTVSAYRKFKNDDGKLEAVYVIGIPRLDLRSIADGSIRPSDLVESRPLLGRFLISRSFLVTNGISWPAELPAAVQPIGFHALCLMSATRAASTADASYIWREPTISAPASVQCSQEDIARLADVLSSFLLTRGDYLSEMALKRLIIQLHLANYPHGAGLSKKIKALRGLLDDFNKLTLFVGYFAYFAISNLRRKRA